MGNSFQGISSNSKYAIIYKWGKLVTITGGAQAIVQGTGLICGILVIRLLPTQDYAWYTLANAMLGTMGILADGGITIGVMAQGGPVWQDKGKLGTVIATGLDLRKKFGIVSLLVVVPIMIYLLVHHGASWLTSVLIIAALIPAFFGALSDSILEVAPKLHQDISSLQKNQISVSLGRLFLTALLLFLFPFTAIAMLAAGIPRIYGNIGMRKISNRFVDKTQRPNSEIKKNILSVVKRILPGAVYFCLSGQITIWLLSIFGNTSSIAEVGALGRLTMLLSFFSVMVSTIIVPRFARLKNDKSILLTRFLQIVGLLLLLCISIIAAFWLFPQPILSILGNKYSGLHKELLVNIIGSCISLIWGCIFNIYSSRGWILNPVLSIIVSIGAIGSGLAIFNLSTVTGVLSLNIFVALIEFTCHASYAMYKILTVKEIDEVNIA